MEPIRVFVSHSSKDRDMAVELEEAMRELRMEPFLAHRDIEVGESWREAIRKEIVECDVLVALVTPNFRESEYTEQEVGAAWVLEKPVLVVLTGGAMPTGFITERQGVKYDTKFVGNTACSILKFALSEIVGREKLGNNLARMLLESGSYHETNCLVNLLAREERLTEIQITVMGAALKTNPQVYGAFAKRRLLRLLREHEENQGS